MHVRTQSQKFIQLLDYYWSKTCFKEQAAKYNASTEKKFFFIITIMHEIGHLLERMHKNQKLRHKKATVNEYKPREENQALLSKSKDAIRTHITNLFVSH